MEMTDNNEGNPPEWDEKLENFYKFEWDKEKLECGTTPLPSEKPSLSQTVGLSYPSLLYELFYEGPFESIAPKANESQQRITFARKSTFTVTEMAKYLSMENRFKDVTSYADVPETSMKQYVEFKTMQTKVKQEQDEYQQRLYQLASESLHQYNAIDPSVTRWIQEIMYKFSIFVRRYPQYYTNFKSFDINVVPFTTDSLPVQIGVCCSLQGGSLRQIKLPKVFPDYFTQKSMPFKRNKKIKSGDFWVKTVVSEDANAEKLAIEWNADVVICFDSLFNLANNHTNFQREWEVPVVVKKLNNPAMSKTRKYVTFINDALPPKSMTPREKNALYFESLFKRESGANVFCDDLEKINELAKITAENISLGNVLPDLVKETSLKEATEEVLKSVSAIATANTSEDDDALQIDVTDDSDIPQVDGANDTKRKPATRASRRLKNVSAASTSSSAPVKRAVEKNKMSDSDSDSESLSKVASVEKEKNRKLAVESQQTKNPEQGKSDSNTTGKNDSPFSFLNVDDSAKKMRMSMFQVDKWKSSFHSKSGPLKTNTFFTDGTKTFKPYSGKSSQKKPEFVRSKAKGSTKKFQLSFSSASLSTKSMFGEKYAKQGDSVLNLGLGKKNIIEEFSEESDDLIEVEDSAHTKKTAQTEERATEKNSSKGEEVSESPDISLSQTILAAFGKGSKRRKTFDDIKAMNVNTSTPNTSRRTKFSWKSDREAELVNKGFEDNETVDVSKDVETINRREEGSQEKSMEKSDSNDLLGSILGSYPLTTSPIEKKPSSSNLSSLGPFTPSSDLLGQILGKKMPKKRTSAKDISSAWAIEAENLRRKDLRSPKESLPAVKGLKAPAKGENIAYSLWEFGKKRVLVRYSFDGKFSEDLMKKHSCRGAALKTKLEYQSEYGLEQLTISEACCDWLTNLILPHDVKIARARIDPLRYMIIDVEVWNGMSCALNQANSAGFNPHIASKLLSTMFEKLAELEKGIYILSHKSEESKVTVRKTVADPSKVVVYNLHEEYKCPGRDASYTQVPWVPVNPAKFTKRHAKRIPLTFEPRDDKVVNTGDRTNPPQSKSKKKNSKKKGKKRLNHH